MVIKILGVVALGCLGAGAVYAQRLDIPRILTVVLPHSINQQRCLESGVNALQTAGFVELTASGGDGDRTIYGRAEGTNALFRCSQTNRVIIFALSTVNVGVDTRSVGQAVIELFARSSGVVIPR